ncbi:hypothetical protein KI387_025608 [Taxus chinensis]|uniref:long-chain-alcohol O-fatty-acyltransferase n=1 Tax=Taxus chinensis TaxID=29808 RepID=A0AA38FWV8_TAXCH|nr:hypothetical protein KI387_025608 [Taxus chinensis]
MDNQLYAEELIREFLVFRGFTNTLRAFEAELSTDIGKSFQVDKILDLIFAVYMPKFEADKLVGLLNFLKTCFFSPSDERFTSTLAKLELATMRYYIVYALQKGRQDKVVEFFGRHGNDFLQNADDWSPWLDEMGSIQESSTKQITEGTNAQDASLSKESESGAALSTYISEEKLHGKQSYYLAAPASGSFASGVERDVEAFNNLSVGNSTMSEISSRDPAGESPESEPGGDTWSEEDFSEVTVEFQETFSGHTSPITKCRFSAAGTNIASASVDGTVRIWTYDSSTPTSRNATIYCGAEIMSLDWEYKSDRLLLIGTAQGGIKAWNVDAKRVVCDLSTSAAFPNVLDLKCSPVEPIFVSAAASRGHGSKGIERMGFASLTAWNMKTWKPLTVLPLGEDPPAITSVCFNHNGKILAASATDGMIHMFDMSAGLPITGWPAHDSAVSNVKFGPDEASIFSLGADGKEPHQLSTSCGFLDPPTNPFKIHELTYSGATVRHYAYTSGNNAKPIDRGILHERINQNNLSPPHNIIDDDMPSLEGNPYYVLTLDNIHDYDMQQAEDMPPLEDNPYYVPTLDDNHIHDYDIQAEDISSHQTRISLGNSIVNSLKRKRIDNIHNDEIHQTKDISTHNDQTPILGDNTTQKIVKKEKKMDHWKIDKLRKKLRYEDNVQRAFTRLLCALSMLPPQSISHIGQKHTVNSKPIMKKISVKPAGGGNNLCEPTEDPMTPKGAILCHPPMDTYILSIVGLRKQVDVPSMKQALQSTLVNHKPFSSSRKKGKWGNYMWVHKEAIDIDKHVIVPNLDPQHTQCQEFVENYTASLASDPPLDPSRPLWQIHVLNYRSGEAEASLVFKIHHCVGDCVSLMSLFMECTTKATDGDSIPTVGNADRRINRVSSNWRSFNFVQTVCNLIIVFWLTVKDFFNLVATILWLKDSKIFRGARPICPRRLAHVTIDMQDVGVVKNALKCTVNDVVVGMLSAGFMQYIKRRQEAVWKGSSVDKVIAKLRLRALVAVNMRPLPGLHRLEYMLNNPKQARWGNGFGTWLLRIPLKKHEDPLNYCRIARANLLKKKASMEAPLMFFLLGLVSCFSLVKLAMHLLYRVTLNTTMVVSNVLGPVDDVEFMGNPVTHIITTVSWLPQPLVIHFQSYAGKAKLAVMALEDVMPDPLQLCMECVDALKQMKEAALRS